MHIKDREDSDQRSKTEIAHYKLEIEINGQKDQHKINRLGSKLEINNRNI